MTLIDIEIMHRLIAITEANLLNHQFGVTQLAQEMGMSRSNLHRKIKKLYHCSISRFICYARLNKAIEILRSDRPVSISATAFECGFRSVTYFDKCFHDYFGFAPGEVRKQIQKGEKTNLSIK